MIYNDIYIRISYDFLILIFCYDWSLLVALTFFVHYEKN